MDVKIDVAEKQNVVEPGDIIVFNSDHVHVVTNHSVNGYKNASVSINSYTLDPNPQEAVAQGHATLYKASEYELVLRKKST